MEVGVKIIAENVLTAEKRHTNSCYVTYVALDDQGVPTPVPPIVPETADEKRRYDRAAKRRGSRVMDCRYDIEIGRGTAELLSPFNIVFRLLVEKQNSHR